jgi:dephospho-CoA kinase
LFAVHGAAIVDTDAIARELTSAGGRAMLDIGSTFGAGYVNTDGSLNRSAMRALVFSDTEARRRLEQILHPLIKAEAMRCLSRARAPYVVLVVPLLLEHWGDYRGLVDRVLVVDCDVARQLQRISARPGMDDGQAKAILAAQSGREARLAMADDVIDNRGDRAALSEQVAALHGRYLTMAGKHKATT